ncbi:MAG: putative adhesin [Polyangiales bacterium]
MAVIRGSGVHGTVVFAGYGWQSRGTLTVPEGTMIRIPQPYDGRLLDHHGQLIERTGRVPVELLTEGYWPGMTVPNLWLGPPGALGTLPTSTIVTSPTPLSELLLPYMGVCLWAACRVERWGGDCESFSGSASR